MENLDFFYSPIVAFLFLAPMLSKDRVNIYYIKRLIKIVKYTRKLPKVCYIALQAQFNSF